MPRLSELGGRRNVGRGGRVGELGGTPPHEAKREAGQVILQLRNPIVSAIRSVRRVGTNCHEIPPLST